MSTTNRQYIIDWSLNLNPVESMEIANDPSFEESGLIKFQLHTHREIGEISIDEEATFVIQDSYSTFNSEFHAIKLSLLCSDDDQQVTDYSIETILDSMGVHHLLIDLVKPQIVSKAIQMAIDTKNRGLKQFGLMVDIDVTTLTEVVPEIDEEGELDLMDEEELGWVLREMNLKPNPALKSSIEKLKKGVFECGVGVMKNCVVCLDDFEIGSEVIWMPCSHMFHGVGCLLPWLEESNSCPLCRLELMD